MYKVSEKKHTKEMQLSYVSISAMKKPRCVNQFPYRDVYLSRIILGMSLIRFWVNCKTMVAEDVEKEKCWEAEKKTKFCNKADVLP